MVAVEELAEGDEVVVALAHLLSGDGDHVVVHPVAHRLVALGGHALGDLAFMVGEHEVHAAAVDVERLAEIFAPHSGAFEMPAGEAFAPGRGPVHDMLRGSLLPEGEVHRIVLLLLAVEGAGGVLQLFDVAARELAVMMVAVIFLDVEIDRSAAFVGITRFKNLLHIFDLLYDMARGVRLDRGGKHVERLHVVVVVVEIMLHHFHRFETFETRFLGDLVFARIGVMLEMAHVGDVAHIAHLVA